MIRLGPLFYLPCDDAASPLLDHSGNGFNFATVGGVVNYQVTGLIPTSANTAVKRSSSTFQHVALPYSGQTYTWLYWVNTLDTAHALPMLIQANVNPGLLNQHYQFRLNIDVPELILFDAAQIAYIHNTGLHIADGKTHFLAFTYDGTFSRFYHNGALVGAPVNLGCTLQVSNFNTFVTGAGGTAGGDPEVGTSDEIAVYLRALSADEISGIYALATTLT